MTQPARPARTTTAAMTAATRPARGGRAIDFPIVMTISLHQARRKTGSGGHAGGTSRPRCEAHRALPEITTGIKTHLFRIIFVTVISNRYIFYQAATLNINALHDG